MSKDCPGSPAFGRVEQMAGLGPHPGYNAADIAAQVGPAFKRCRNIGQRAQREDRQRPRLKCGS